MKKLMIAAAAAATAGSIFGATAQVYDMTITVKSTECKDNKKLYKNVCADDVQFYRAQATQKFYGKFWGCGCETLCAPVVYGAPREDKSFVFWGKDGAFHDAKIDWSVLQLVGKNGTNVEGAFNLELYTCEDGTVAADPDFTLAGAGYGTASVVACGDEDNYVKSMSGSVVGVANVAALADVTGCKYCGDIVDCNVWDYCDCVAADNAVSAAFGTFTLKYNASQAKALAKGKWIDEANKFKSFVTDEFACIAAGNVPPAPVEDPKEVAQERYAAAKKAYEAAEKALAEANKAVNDLANTPANSVKGQELAQAVTDATADQDAKATALATAERAPELADFVAAKVNVATAEAEVAAAQAALDAELDPAQIPDKRTALQNAKDALENANLALANAKNAADADKMAAYEKALAEKEAADKAVVDANNAVAEWNATGWKDAKDAADKAVAPAQEAFDKADSEFLQAKVQCGTVGAECK